MSHPIMHWIGNAVVALLYVVGLPLAVLYPQKPPHVVRLERSIERLERIAERLENERPMMQQTNKVEVQVPPDESAARRMFIEQLAASYRDGK